MTTLQRNRLIAALVLAFWLLACLRLVVTS